MVRADAALDHARARRERVDPRRDRGRLGRAAPLRGRGAAAGGALLPRALGGRRCAAGLGRGDDDPACAVRLPAAALGHDRYGDRRRRLGRGLTPVRALHPLRCVVRVDLRQPGDDRRALRVRLRVVDRVLRGRPGRRDDTSPRRGQPGGALAVRVRVVGAVAARQRLPLTVAAVRARRKMLGRPNVDRLAAIGAAVGPTRNVTAGGNWLSHGSPPWSGVEKPLPRQRKSNPPSVAKLTIDSGGCGGTGRRAAFRSPWALRPWRFESSQPHFLATRLRPGRFGSPAISFRGSPGPRGMSKITADISVSLDGFIAGPEPTLEEPLGRGGEQLHEWAMATKAWREPHGLEGGDAGPDSDVVQRAVANIGAVVMGRRMFSGEGGPWGDEPWQGWWGDEPPFHVPVYVLTNYEREPLEKQGGTTFYFVTEGAEAALAQAKAVAGEKDISIAGGADVIQQYIRLEAIDELAIHVAP